LIIPTLFYIMQTILYFLPYLMFILGNENIRQAQLAKKETFPSSAWEREKQTRD
jgi:hypothetical protein